jgi:hypothetical protein
MCVCFLLLVAQFSIDPFSAQFPMVQSPLLTYSIVVVYAHIFTLCEHSLPRQGTLIYLTNIFSSDSFICICIFWLDWSTAGRGCSSTHQQSIIWERPFIKRFKRGADLDGADEGIHPPRGIYMFIFTIFCGKVSFGRGPQIPRQGGIKIMH